MLCHRIGSGLLVFLFLLENYDYRDNYCQCCCEYRSRSRCPTILLLGVDAALLVPAIGGHRTVRSTAPYAISTIPVHSLPSNNAENEQEEQEEGPKENFNDNIDSNFNNIPWHEGTALLCDLARSFFTPRSVGTDTTEVKSAAITSSRTSSTPTPKASPANTELFIDGHHPIFADSTTSHAIVFRNAPPPPRWHPVRGIADQNPNFRTQAPEMNAQGWAATIWRNARKHRHHPSSVWRHALMTYDRGMRSPALRSTATHVHHEGALVACAKLGLWERALEIYQSVDVAQRRRQQQQQQQEQEQNDEQQQKLKLRRQALSGVTENATRTRAQKQGRTRREIASVSTQTAAIAATAAISSCTSSTTASGVFVTEAMLESVIRACVRASRNSQLPGPRRAPLDAAVHLLQDVAAASSSSSTSSSLSLSDSNNNTCNMNQPQQQHVPTFPVVARHVNPLAAAYQTLGLWTEAQAVLTTVPLLTNRTRGPEAEDGHDVFNVNDVSAKDKASYALLVQSAVAQGDFVAAIEQLKTMTEAGLYPHQRHLNVWTELAERKSQRRTTHSWTKKRDENWLESVR